MKSIIIFLSFLFSYSTIIIAQNDTSTVYTIKNQWKTNTTKTVDPGTITFGIVAPLTIGLKNNMDISVHPLTFFIMPNARLKKNWSSKSTKRFQIASTHGFTYPTLLIKTLSTNGTIAIYPPNETVTEIITLDNSILGSYYYHADHTLSFKAGIEFNLLYSSYGDFPEVELLYIYPRTASYSNPFTINTAIEANGKISNKFGYEAALSIYYIPTTNATWVYEFIPKLYFNKSDKFRIQAVLNLTTGNIPHEKQDFRVMPFVDFQWSIFSN